MPIDENGNRADIVMDPYSTISRMNIGRLYEQYINAASRDVRLKVCKELSLTERDKGLENKIWDISKSNPALIDKVWNYLLGYYKIVSPKMFLWLNDSYNEGQRMHHLMCIISKAIYLYMPTNNAPEPEDMIKELEKYYRPTYGSVSYVGNSGQRHYTKNPVRIGSLYIILLEKTGDDWTAVSSGKIQHFGILSQVTNSDKYSQPSRQQAIRAMGESEVRIYVSYAGPMITADLLDRNNNPGTHKQILYSILESETPTNIQSAVNRNIIPLGGAKPIQLVKHIMSCSGVKFVYAPYFDVAKGYAQKSYR